MDAFGGFPGRYPDAGNPLPKQTRIANPAGGPDQFHAKKGILSYTLYRKGILRDNPRNPGHFQRDLKTLTGINRWPNGARIVVGQGWGTVWTLSGDPPDYIPTQEIHSRNRPGLPIRHVARINFMQKAGTYVHTFPERHDKTTNWESGLFPKRLKNINRH